MFFSRWREVLKKSQTHFFSSIFSSLRYLRCTRHYHSFKKIELLALFYSVISSRCNIQIMALIVGHSQTRYLENFVNKDQTERYWTMVQLCTPARFSFWTTAPSAEKCWAETDFISVVKVLRQYPAGSSMELELHCVMLMYQM